MALGSAREPAPTPRATLPVTSGGVPLPLVHHSRYSAFRYRALSSARAPHVQPSPPSSPSLPSCQPARQPPQPPPHRPSLRPCPSQLEPLAPSHHPAARPSTPPPTPPT